MAILLWIFVPGFTAAGSALLICFMMRCRMDEAIARERGALAELQSALIVQRRTLESAIAHRLQRPRHGRLEARETDQSRRGQHLFVDHHDGAEEVIHRGPRLVIERSRPGPWPRRSGHWLVNMRAPANSPARIGRSPLSGGLPGWGSGPTKCGPSHGPTGTQTQPRLWRWPKAPAERVRDPPRRPPAA